MPKAPSQKGQRRIEEILDAAERILIEDGYGGFSMRRVAERLGLRLSNIQYYFRGPDALLGALFDRSLARSLAAFEARPETDGLAGMAAFVLEEQLSADNCRMFFELWALAARDMRIDAVLKRYYTRYQAEIERALATQCPHVPPAKRKRQAVILMSLFEGLSLFRGTPDRLDVSRRALDKEIAGTVLQIAGCEDWS